MHLIMFIYLFKQKINVPKGKYCDKHVFKLWKVTMISGDGV
jgi:hypothetical protein